MNVTQLGGIIRTVLMWLLGYFAAKGLVPESMIADIAGVAAAIAVAVWSYYTNKTSTMISRVAASDTVEAVITDNATAMADPNPKSDPIYYSRNIEMNWFSSTLSWLVGLFVPQPSGGDPVKVAQIQAKVVQLCGFLPMVETVAGILAAGNPAVITVSAVASSICRVVSKIPTPIATMGLMSMSDVESPPVYGEIEGVPVQGVFVGK